MLNFKPFSNDIIFFDSEFTRSGILKGDLISIGMISLDGKKELYLELEFDEKKMSDWTRENVFPYLQGNPISREEVKKKIREFCGHSEPFLIATVNQFDMAFWHDLFDGEKEPIHRIPIDFASILFGLGLNPAREIDGEKSKFYAQFGIDLNNYKLHNSLDDAKLMRELYFRLVEK
jgi:DNA polymerase III epsilon subunit-like protein